MTRKMNSAGCWYKHAPRRDHDDDDDDDDYDAR